MNNNCFMNEKYQLTSWVRPEIKQLPVVNTAADCTADGKVLGLNDALSPTTCQS